MRRVTVVTGGHLSTCPRMVKAADAFHAAGHRVRVISTVSTPWATAADDVFRSRPWRWERIDYTRGGAPSRWALSGVRQRASLALAARWPDHAPLGLAARTIARVHDELVAAILRDPGDLVYGGTLGALAAAVEAAAAAGVPCGVDFEDLHDGEHEPQGDGPLRDALAARLMRQALDQAVVVTAGSAAIAEACAAKYGRRPLPINNVFSLPAQPPAFRRDDGPLRLYWFSQTIGPGRGLEDVIDAVGKAALAAELHLRGAVGPEYAEHLRRRAWLIARRLTIVFHTPAAPDQMVECCQGFDAGISAEQGHIPNRQVNLSNKALVYPLAGLALVLTETRGHAPLSADLHDRLVHYRPGDIDTLAAGLVRLSDPAWRRDAQQASWEAARTRWHWDHPCERQALVDAVEQAL